MPIYELDGKRPTIARSAYIHPTAVIIGDVTIGENCWIGPNATIRGDDHSIRIEDGSDVQDNCVIHGETVLGAQVPNGTRGGSPRLSPGRGSPGGDECRGPRRGCVSGTGWWWQRAR